MVVPYLCSSQIQKLRLDLASSRGTSAWEGTDQTKKRPGVAICKILAKASSINLINLVLNGFLPCHPSATLEADGTGCTSFCPLPIGYTNSPVQTSKSYTFLIPGQNLTLL